MPRLRVTPTGRRLAFDIIEGAPEIHELRAATRLFVEYRDSFEEGRIATYAHDIGFGPTIRHYINISERIIRRYGFIVGQILNSELIIGDDGAHIYRILDE